MPSCCRAALYSAIVDAKAAISAAPGPLDFPNFFSWCLRNKVADEDELDEAIDSAYNDDTGLDVLLAGMDGLIPNSKAKFNKAKALKAAKAAAEWTVQGSSPVDKKVKAAASKFAAAFAAHVEKHWPDLVKYYGDE